MRAVQYHRLGPPENVLDLSDVDDPHAGPGQVRVRVHWCGFNPADWALCEGLFSGTLPRGIGLEASGTVDEVGPEVPGVARGDAVFGPVPFGAPTAGAADVAVLADWAPVPDGLDLATAASLPMVGETAWRCLDDLGVTAGQLVLVHGAGSMVGRVAVQLALHRGARVIATAGPRHVAALEASGALVTGYGAGMRERVEQLAGGTVDRALSAAPVGGALADLVAVTGDRDHVLTVSDFAEAEELGVRLPSGTPRNDVLPEVAALALSGAVTVPIAATLPLEEFGEAIRLSRSQQAGGKILACLA